MTRRPPKHALLLLALPLAACGGSSHSSSSAAASTTQTTGNVTVTTASSSSAQPPPKHHKHHASTRDTNVRLPASFTIHAGGTLTPPSIAAPRHTDVKLIIRSGDGKQHSLAIDLPHRYATTVRPGHPVRKLLTKLLSGHYVIVVDGAARGTLIVGAVPGP